MEQWMYSDEYGGMVFKAPGLLIMAILRTGLCPMVMYGFYEEQLIYSILNKNSF